MVAIKVNGESREFQDRISVAQLLEELGLPRDAIAVEVNRTIIPRRSHETQYLGEGDEVEIVTFVGGG